MLSEKITRERLKSFYEQCLYAQRLEQQLEEFRKQYNTLKAVNTDKTKVIDGSARPHSPQESYLQAIESKSNKLKAAKNLIDTERAIITRQIGRLTKPEYKDILTERYLLLKDWKNISFEYFGTEKDYWVYRETKYHFIVMTWHKRAIKELEQISAKPFVQEEIKQGLLW